MGAREKMDLDDFYAKIDASERAVEEGRVIDQEDLKREILTWGMRPKTDGQNQNQNFMESKSAEYLKEYELWYDLMVKWKDAEHPEAKAGFQDLLDRFGFWAPDDSGQSPYLTPYQKHRKSFVFQSPEAWKLGEFPVPGHYVLVKVWQTDREDEKGWHIQVRNFEFRHGGVVMPRGRSIYLFCFIEGSEILRRKIFDFSLSRYQDEIPPTGSPAFEKLQGWNEKVAELRTECLRMAPELRHFAWPEVLKFEGSWKEKPENHPEYFKKTLSLVMGEFYPGMQKRVQFQPLQWANESACLTSKVTYKVMDEHAYRMYGVKEMVEIEKEVGVWLTKSEGFLSFKVIRRAGSKWFWEFSGKLFPNRIELEIDCPRSKENKDFMLNYFAEYGIQPTNIPDFSDQD